MAWTFGYWIADGWMSRNKNIISFSSNDHDLLEIVKSNLKSEHKIYKNGEKCYQLTINNRIIYNDLLKLGGIPLKSLTIKFPDVPNEFLPHFIRGYLDGDGCNHIDKNKYLRSSFAGNIDFLTSLKSKIKEYANIDATNLNSLGKKCNPRIRSLGYNGKKAIALGNYIYQDSENLRLERKFKKYDEVKKEHIKKLEEKEKRENN